MTLQIQLLMQPVQDNMHEDPSSQLFPAVLARWPNSVSAVLLCRFVRHSEVFAVRLRTDFHKSGSYIYTNNLFPQIIKSTLILHNKSRGLNILKSIFKMAKVLFKRGHLIMT